MVTEGLGEDNRDFSTAQTWKTSKKPIMARSGRKGARY